MPIASSFGRVCSRLPGWRPCWSRIGRGDHLGVSLIVVGLTVATAAFVTVLQALGEPRLAQVAAGVPGLRNSFPRA
jgi:hypothetical protein